MSTLASKDDYLRYFDPERYLECLYADPNGPGYEFLIRRFHDIFSKGDIKGERLLDIGTGPTIHTVISASAVVDEIYLSDYAEQNLKILRSWLSGEREIQNQFVGKICELEKIQNHFDLSIEERTNIVRKKVKKIFHIDITNLESLKTSDVPYKYDVITSCYCLDYVTGTRENYTRCVRNMFTLLNNEGVLVIVGDLNGAVFRFDGMTYPSVNLNKEELCSIYREAGFNIVSFEYVSATNDVCAEENKDVEFVTFVMVARKGRI